MNDEVTVKLNAPHTHLDKKQLRGDLIVVAQWLADWLIQRGIAELTTMIDNKVAKQ